MKLKTLNQESIKKTIEKLLKDKRTIVVQPTGSGKSYVAKEVIKNVASFKRILWVAPNNEILDQVEKRTKRGLKKKEILCCTYQKLTKSSVNPGNLDLLILDEAHRTGAEHWGAAVDELILKNPEVSILGLTATPNRGDGRNVIDSEFFNYGAANTISLSEAWKRKMLPTPKKYVTGLYDINKVYKEMVEKINRSKLSEDEKKNSIALLDKTKIDWEKSSNVSKIIAKYVSKRVKKIIIFVEDIAAIKKFTPNIEDWFKAAGFMPNIYTAYTGMTKKQEAENLAAFKNSKDGLNILILVNKYNEGVHIPKVNCVMLLRRTTSNIVYHQQLGRVCDINGTRPIVLDLVDNLTNFSIRDTIIDYNKYISSQNIESMGMGIRKRMEVEFIDNLIEINQVINVLERKLQDSMMENKNLIKIEAKRCREDENYKPEIKYGSSAYYYIKSHKSGGNASHNPDCDIVWDRIRNTRTDKMAKFIKLEAEKCRKDINYIPEIKYGSSKVYNYIREHRSGSRSPHNPDCDIVWDRIRDTRTDELAKIAKIEAEKCRKDINYIPEIKVGSRVYNYIRDHKSGSKFSHNPDCDIIWERIRKLIKTDEAAKIAKIEAEKCKKR